MAAIFKVGHKHKKAGVIVGGLLLQQLPQALCRSSPMKRLN
jgi:hypothetical protein